MMNAKRYLLEDFRYDWPFGVLDMCTRSGLTKADTEKLLSSSDVLLFSHNFRKPTLHGVRLPNRFAPIAQDVCSAFGRRGYRASLVHPVDSEPRLLGLRRSDEWITPVIVILSSVALPVCLNILASYIKERIDKAVNRHASGRKVLEVDICVVETSGRRERWYKFRGNGAQVLALLEALRYEGEGSD